MNIFSLLKKWTRISLVLRILIGLVIGLLLGLFCPHLQFVGILGQVFVSALKAIAPILVAVLVAASIAKAKGGLGGRFSTVITLYLLSTFLAAMVAVVGSFLFPVTMTLKEAASGDAPEGLDDLFIHLLTNMVLNPLHSITAGNYIGILFWAVVMGIALKLRASQHTIQVVSDFSDVILQTVGWVIQFAPFGIMGLVFSSVSESGLEIFTDYGKLLLLFVGCMLFTSLILNPFIVFLYLRRNPYPLV